MVQGAAALLYLTSGAHPRSGGGRVPRHLLLRSLVDTLPDRDSPHSNSSGIVFVVNILMRFSNIVYVTLRGHLT